MPGHAAGRLIDNPYVGPRTFTENERDLFFGREREARDLLSLVISNRLVLFYAQSGAGKSSLLNTRLIPQLKAEGFVTLPIGRVSGEPPEDIDRVDNIYSFNLMLSLDQSDSQAGRLASLTLSDFLAGLTRRENRFVYAAAEGDSDTSSRREQLNIPRVLIIDQFEEIVTTHPDRWQERETFFRQIDEAMSADPLLWVVLTLREDYVAALDPYASLLRNRLRSRFYMQRMGHKAALEAIRRPAEEGGRPFAPHVAEILVDNLRQIRIQSRIQTGQFVEPVQLQVVCYQLWENLKGRPMGEITAKDLQELGDVDSTLIQFYEQAVIRVTRQARNSENAVRNWFDRELITEAGTRGIVYRGPKKTGSLNNKTVDLLERQFLLHSEMRAGGVWYELSHDRFVEPILQSNDAWRAHVFKRRAILGTMIGLLLLVVIALGLTSFQRSRASEARRSAEATATAISATSTAQIVAISTEVAGGRRARPLRPGASLSGASVIDAGTLGYFLEDEAGQLYILSTDRVLGRAEATNGAGESDQEGYSGIIQPGFLDNGEAPGDVIASRVIDNLNRLDDDIPAAYLVALAKMTADIEFDPFIPEIGRVQGARAPQFDMEIRKYGRSTGLTGGRITAIGQIVDISRDQYQFQPAPSKKLHDAIVTTLRASDGDLGALVVDKDGYAVGIIVHIRDGAAILAPIETVLETFKVQLHIPEEITPSNTGGPIPKGANPYIYGLHDRGGENLMIVDGEAKGWVLVTEAIGSDPNERGGGDYRDITDRGLGLIVRLNQSYGPNGTIPREARYPEFAQRVANFVEDSRGANIWMIGYEMNFEREQPRREGSNEAEPITPRRYAELYKLVRQKIKALPGHESDLVITGPIGPWNAQTPYDADPQGKYPANKIAGAPNEYPYHGFFGDFILYLRDMLLAIGPENLDGIAIQAISHGYDPDLVFSDEKMGPPFSEYHYHFRTYQDQMNVIPDSMRHLPVYIVRMEGDREPDGTTWPFGNNGWIKNAYQEIDDWNRAGNQQIRAGVLFRWMLDPIGWTIDGKPGVQQDFREAIAKNYRWGYGTEASARPAPAPAPVPVQPAPVPVVSATPTPLAAPIAPEIGPDEGYRTVRVGLYGRNAPEFQEADYALIQEAGLESLVLLSTVRIDIFERIKEDYPGIEIIVQLYDDRFDPGNHPTPLEFAERMVPVMNQFRPYASKFQIHNEPNHLARIEGWGDSDEDARNFSQWFIEVYDLLKAQAPWAELGFPGLAIPHRDLEWVEIARPAVEKADWLGVHTFWQTPPDQTQNHLADFWGLRFKYYHEKFPDKLIEITQFGNVNVQNNIPFTRESLSREYIEYYAELFKYPYLRSANAFIMSSPDPTWNGFAWRGESGERYPVVEDVGEMARPDLIELDDLPAITPTPAAASAAVAPETGSISTSTSDIAPPVLEPVGDIAPPPVEWVGSPNFNNRRDPNDITAIVMNATSNNSLEDVIAWFSRPDAQTSAHYTIGKDGQIVQHVRDDLRAWSAGRSVWKGRNSVNDFAISIELVNLNDGEDLYPEAQHQAAVSLVSYLSEKYSIGVDDIVGHKDVAIPPGRKSDPRGYDLDRLRREVAELRKVEFVTSTEVAPTSAPGATAPQSTAAPACAFEPGDIFFDLWVEYSSRLGCPQAQIPGSGAFVEQPFENGRMLWAQPLEQFLILIGDEAGEWQGTPREELAPGESCLSEPPAGLLRPERGFSLLWCQQPEISERIGFALEPETSNDDYLFQAFEQGLILRSGEGEIYLLFEDDGSYLRP